MESQEASEKFEAAPTLIQPQEIPCAELPIEARVEAVLLSINRPVSESKLVEFLGLDVIVSKSKGSIKTAETSATDKSTEKSSGALVRQAIEQLNANYLASSRSFRIEKLAGGWQLLTLSKFAPLLTRVHGAKLLGRLSSVYIETLAIVAYRQPILRSELEAVRGVACGDVLRGLMERRLVRITGRAEELGRPMLYGTTTEFLRTYGIARIEDLPQARELRNPAG